jgi:hypothetical protein
VEIRRVLSGIDVAPLLVQVRAHPELWDIDDSWTRKSGWANPKQSAIYDVSNIVLRWNRSPDWDKPAFDILSAARPIVEAIMELSGGDLLGKVLVTRLQPGQRIQPHVHISPPGIPRVYHTFQVPLHVLPGCVFGCGADPRPTGSHEDEIYMEPGNAYWFENTMIHWVYNDSPDERISMLMDIRLPDGATRV